MSNFFDLLVISEWLGIATLMSAIFTVLAFVFGWGVRFRFVGITSFTALVAIGVLALKLSLYQRVSIEGAERFSTVYDNGGAEVVIVLKPEVTDPDTIRATLTQAAYDSYSPGRLNSNKDNQMTIRARILLHPEAGVTQPVYVGQVKRTLASREDENMEIAVDEAAIAQVITQTASDS